MGDHLETEQKYDADADFVLPKLGKSAPRRIYLSATYFDTEDLLLIQHRITLRRRVGGDDEGWHLKLPVRKDTRQELHAPLDEGAPGSVPARLAAQVEEITAGHALRPIAILDTERTTLTVAGPAGKALAEVADDRVTATRFGDPDDEPMAWREIEVEAKSPDAGDLLETVGLRVEARARPRHRLTLRLGRRGNS